MRYMISILALLGCIYPTLADALNLQEVLHMARQENPALQADALSIRIAQEEVDAARSSLLPTVDLSGKYTILNEPQGITVGGAAMATQDRTFASGSLAIEQTLHDFGRRAAQIEQSKILLQATESSYRGREQDVVVQTIVAYYRILEGNRMLQAASEEVEQTGAHLRQSRLLYEQGVVTRNDVLQAEVQLAASRQRELTRRNELENSWLALNYLTGRPEIARDQLEEEPLQELPPPPEDIPTAVAQRPELEAQRLRVNAGRQQVEESRSAFMPTLFARVGADYIENSHATEQTMVGATAGFRINLFDGFASSTRLGQALARKLKAERELHNLSEQARLEYQSARNDAQVAWKRIAVAREAITQGEENLRINRNRYQEQVGTATEVLDAQTLLTLTRTNYFQAIFDYQIALARVRRATGSI